MLINKTRLSLCLYSALLLIVSFIGTTSGQTMSLHVDATKASRNILRSTLKIPVKPGPLTLFFPKWIPGEHTPTGPIDDIVGLKLSRGGKAIPWGREDVETCDCGCQI